MSNHFPEKYFHYTHLVLYDNHAIPEVLAESGLRFDLEDFTSSELRPLLDFFWCFDKMISLAVTLRSRTGLKYNSCITITTNSLLFFEYTAKRCLSCLIMMCMLIHYLDGDCPKRSASSLSNLSAKAETYNDKKIL